MEGETRRFKLIVLVGLMFLVSAWASCQEMKYAIWGRTAEAQVYSAEKVSVSSGRRVKNTVAVRYRWSDADDGEREDVQNLDLSWQRPADDVIRIEYLPGVKASRMAGERNWVAITIFLVVSGVMVFVVVKTWREGSR